MNAKTENIFFSNFIFRFVLIEKKRRKKERKRSLVVPFHTRISLLLPVLSVF